MNPIRDFSRLFSRGLAIVWLLIVCVPLVVSVVLNNPADGLPLLGIMVWIVLLRVARRLSPAARADALTRKGQYAQALDMAERALSVEGEGAWMGSRRLVWLNRRTTALLAIGHYDAALTSAVEALVTNADSETISNCAQALARLNRYEEATTAARLALELTRERSLTAQTSLALAVLARGMPAEGEALARAGLSDAQALLPLVRTEQYATCLATLARAERLLKRDGSEQRALVELKKIAHSSTLLRAMYLLEDADHRSGGAGEHDLSIEAIVEAQRLAPEYADWFMTQPRAFATLRGDPRYDKIVAEAERRSTELARRAPPTEVVAKAIAFATQTGTPRPAAQASRDALMAQVLTLGGTFLLLLFWTWRFFLAPA